MFISFIPALMANIANDQQQKNSISLYTSLFNIITIGHQLTISLALVSASEHCHSTSYSPLPRWPTCPTHPVNDHIWRSSVLPSDTCSPRDLPSPPAGTHLNRCLPILIGHTCVEVPGRNRTLFCCVFRAH